MENTYSSIYALFTILDEDWDLPSARGLQDFSQLGNGLLKDLGRTNIDFSNDHHDRNIERQSDTEMFSAILLETGP